jgi:hypothetical protein
MESVAWKSLGCVRFGIPPPPNLIAITTTPVCQRALQERLGGSFELRYAIGDGFNFDVDGTQRGRVASDAHFDGTRPLMELGEEFCLDAFKLRQRPFSLALALRQRPFSLALALLQYPLFVALALLQYPLFVVVG